MMQGFTLTCQADGSEKTNLNEKDNLKIEKEKKDVEHAKSSIIEEYSRSII
jgi:hypothetical protein